MRKNSSLFERIRLLSFPNKTSGDKDAENVENNSHSAADKKDANSPPRTPGGGNQSKRDRIGSETASVREAKDEELERNLHSLARNHNPDELQSYLKELARQQNVIGETEEDIDDEESESDVRSSRTFLIKKVNERDEEGLAALHYAARYNNFKSVTLLVEYGADVSAQDYNGATPLHAATRGRKIVSKAVDIFAQKNPNENVIRFADETARIQDGSTVNEAEIGKEYIINYLISHNADPLAADKYGMTPLHYAALRGNLHEARVLIQSGNINIINAKDGQNSTPLHLACSYNWLPICELLVKYKADVFAKDSRDNSPLQLAVEKGNCDIMELLITAALEQGGSDKMIQYINQRNFDYDTPLFIAIAHCNLNAVKLLLDKGADLKMKHKDQNSCFHRACYRANTAVLQLLLDHGGRVDWRNLNHETPLHRACEVGRMEAVNFFLSNNADIESRDKLSRTPLLVAVQSKPENENFQIIELLLQKGANMHTTDKLDRSPVLLAAKANNDKAVELLLKCDECKTAPGLAGIHTDLANRPDRKNNSPIHVAAKLGHLEIVKCLMKYGAGIDLKNEDEATPLHLAAKNGHVKIVDYILQSDECYNLVRDEDESSNTPLHLAAAAGKDEVIKKLITYSTELIETKNAQRLTPLACAASKGQKSTVELLIQLGAKVNPTDIRETTALQLACKEGHTTVVDLLLRSGAISDYLDFKGRNSLDLAIEYNQGEAAKWLIKSDKNWEQLLKHSKIVDMNGKTRSTPMRELIRKMPELARQVLDQCITINQKERTKTYNFEYIDDVYSSWLDESESNDDFVSKALTPRTHQKIKASDPKFNTYYKNGKLRPTAKLYSKNLEEIKGNHPLMRMVDTANEELLSHDLVSSLLNHKWDSYGRYIYYFGLTIYVSFVAFLTDFAINSPPPYKFDEAFFVLPTDFCFNETLIASSIPIPRVKTRSRFSQYMTLVFVCINITKELAQLYFRGKRYFVWQSLIEIIIYACSFLFVIDWTQCSMIYGYRLEDQWLFGVTAVVLAWIDLVLILRKFPSLGIYVVMFTDVLRTFAKFFIVFFLFIVAFALAFFMMFQNQVPFETFSTTIVKTVVMMVGEFEYNAMFYFTSPQDPEKPFYPSTSQAVFFIFAIIMTILIMNLLIGLAVDDIKEVQSKAILKRLAMKVELVLEIEFIAPEFIRRKWVVGHKTVPLRKSVGFIKKIFYELWPKSKAESAEDVYNTLFGQKNKEEAAIKEEEEWSEQCMWEIQQISAAVERVQIQQNKMATALTAIINHLNIPLQQEPVEGEQ